MKKDETTKLKALNDLFEFSSTSLDGHVGQDFLSNFFYLFIRLFFENNRQIRFRTLGILKNFAKINNRSLGPYMKSIIGYWWILTSDICQEVSEVANMAFEEAIPPKKRDSVLQYLSPEIFSIIILNLKHTINSMSTDVNVSVEEATERYERINCSCLVALCQLLEKFPTNEFTNHLSNIPDTKTTDNANNNIIEIVTKKCKESSPTIRKYAYKAIATLTSKCPLLFNNFNPKQMTKFIQKVVTILDERSISNLPTMFESIIAIFKTSPQWFQFIDITNVFIPKLQSLLLNTNTNTTATTSTNTSSSSTIAFGTYEHTLNYLVPLLGIIPAELLSLSPIIENEPCSINNSVKNTNIGCILHFLL